MKIVWKSLVLAFVAVFTFAVAACGEGEGDGGWTEVPKPEFRAKVEALQEADAGYTGGTIKYYTRTVMFGLVEYEGGFTYANGKATLTDPENGNEHGREEAIWAIENRRIWIEGGDHTVAVYKTGEKGFLIETSPFTYEYDANGYFVKETHATLTENDWIIQITWIK